MAKRLRKMDYETKINKEGRGRGVGKDYNPLYTNQDIAPPTRTKRAQDMITGRKTLSLSDDVVRLREVIEYSECAAEIKELYPIGLEESQLIANQIGLQHPHDATTKKIKPIVITLLVTKSHDEEKAEMIAIQYVKSDKLVNRNIVSELELIKMWCKQQGYTFMIVTDEQLKGPLVSNIEKIHSCLAIDSWQGAGLSIPEKIEIISEFLTKYIEFEGTVRELCTCINIL